jgi:hypothetical protein
VPELIDDLVAGVVSAGQRPDGAKPDGLARTTLLSIEADLSKRGIGLGILMRIRRRPCSKCRPG